MWHTNSTAFKWSIRPMSSKKLLDITDAFSSHLHHSKLCRMSSPLTRLSCLCLCAGDTAWRSFHWPTLHISLQLLFY